MVAEYFADVLEQYSIAEDNSLVHPQTQGNGQRNLTTGGVLSLAADGCPTLAIPVTSADEASALLQRYRDHYCIGASDLSESCGNIYANDGTLVAKASYNGQVWNPQGEILQEAVLSERGP